MYTRLANIESSMDGLVKATATSLQDIRGDVTRMDSNNEVQKKYFIKELVKVEEVARSGVEQSKGLQEQLDSMRQQTRVMTESLTSQHKHSEELTKAPTKMMQGMKELHFDMPGHFDDWLKMQLDQAEGGPSTISGEDLRRQTELHLRIPSTCHRSDTNSTSALPHLRTSAPPHLRTSAPPHFRTSAY